MGFKRTLTGIVIAASLILPANASEDSPVSGTHENIQNYQEEVNPIYPIGVIIGSLAISAAAAYYAIREENKNRKKKVLKE
jgi:hypothetical protein